MKRVPTSTLACLIGLVFLSLVSVSAQAPATLQPKSTRRARDGERVLPAAVTSLSRAFLSTIGDDLNGCTSSAPCRTFTRALSVVLPGGEIVVLDPGGFGTATVTQPVSIYVPSGLHGGVTVPSGDALTINTPTEAVVLLRGVHFNSVGGTDAVRVDSIGTLYVENCQMTGFSSHGIDFRSNGRLVLKSTDIRRCGGSGVFVSPPNLAGVLVEASSFSGNDVGIDLRGGAVASISASSAVGNTTAGFRVMTESAAAATLMLTNVAAVDNGIGIAITGSPGAGVARGSLATSLVSQNSTGLFISNSANSILDSQAATSIVTGNGVDVHGTLNRPYARSAVASVPESYVPPGGEAVIPVNLSLANASIKAVDLVLTYDPAVVAPVGVEAGELAAGWLLASNLAFTGSVRVAIAGVEPIVASGQLLRVRFRAAGAAGTQTSVAFSQLSVDEGAVPATGVTGVLHVQVNP